MNRPWRWWCLEMPCINRNPVMHLFASKESLLDFVIWHDGEYHGGMDENAG